ncbi:MAG: T9SS type A sorting domain-containing protein [Ferruginibacter sp.]|nr:T9SS type A sorting domain-containing protein [Cytophagales bacterium]
MKTGFKAIPYIGDALSVLDFFIGGGKKAPGPQSVELTPMAINMTGTYTGTIETTIPYNTFGFRTPGSNPGYAPDSEYPYYNETMGVFNVLETPQCNVQTTQYSLETGPSTGFNDFYSITNYTSYKFRLAQDLKYVVNPASGLVVEEIQAALVFDSYNLNNTNQSVGNLVYEGNAAGVDQYRTNYADLACMDGNIFEVTSSDNPNEVHWEPGRAYVKLLVNLQRRDATDDTQNVLLVVKYPIALVPAASDLGGPSFNPSCSRALYSFQPASEVSTFCQGGAYKTASRGFNNYQEKLQQLEEAERERDEGGRRGQLQPEITAQFEIRPNPTTDRAVIRYGVPQAGAVRITLTDALGKNTAVLLDNPAHRAGYFEVELDGNRQSKGLYFCTVETSTHRKTKKVVLIK